MKAGLSLALCMALLLTGCAQGSATATPTPTDIQTAAVGATATQATARPALKPAILSDPQSGVFSGDTYNNSWANIKLTLPKGASFDKSYISEVEDFDVSSDSLICKAECDEFDLWLSVANMRVISPNREMSPEEVLKESMTFTEPSTTTPMNKTTIANQDFIYCMQFDEDTDWVNYYAGRMIDDTFMLVISCSGYGDYSKVLTCLEPGDEAESIIEGESAAGEKFDPGKLTSYGYKNEWLNLRFAVPKGLEMVPVKGQLEPSDEKHKVGDFISVAVFSAQDYSKVEREEEPRESIYLYLFGSAAMANVDVKTAEEFIEYGKAQDEGYVDKYTRTETRRIGGGDYAFAKCANYDAPNWTQAMYARQVDGHFVLIVIYGDDKDIEGYLSNFTEF